MHPGAKANPFLADAYKANETAATATMGAILIATVRKEAKALAGN